MWNRVPAVKRSWHQYYVTVVLVVSLPMFLWVTLHYLPVTIKHIAAPDEAPHRTRNDESRPELGAAASQRRGWPPSDSSGTGTIVASPTPAPSPLPPTTPVPTPPPICVENPSWKTSWDGQSKYPSLVAPDFPFRAHHRCGSPTDECGVLVVMGLMSMDVRPSARRRHLIRRTWMQTSGIWSDKNTRGAMLLKFVVGLHHNNDFGLSGAIRSEAERHCGDIIALNVREGYPQDHKEQDKYGLYDLRVDVECLSRKTLLWLMLASSAFANVPFYAKMDEDVYLVVPRYLQTLADNIPTSNAYYGFAATCRYVADQIAHNFTYVSGMCITLSSDLARIVVEDNVTRSLVMNPVDDRPWEYLFPRIDREDQMIGSTLARSTARVLVFHDPRIVDPIFLSKKMWQSLDSHYFLRKDAVAIHKLQEHVYDFAAVKYSDKRVQLTAALRRPHFAKLPAPLAFRPLVEWHEHRTKYSRKAPYGCSWIPRWETGMMRIVRNHTSEALPRSLEYFPFDDARAHRDHMTGVRNVLLVRSSDTVEGFVERQILRSAWHASNLTWTPLRLHGVVILRFVVCYKAPASKLMAEEALATGDILPVYCGVKDSRASILFRAIDVAAALFHNVSLWYVQTNAVSLLVPPRIEFFETMKHKAISCADNPKLITSAAQVLIYVSWNSAREFAKTIADFHGMVLRLGIRHIAPLRCVPQKYQETSAP